MKSDEVLSVKNLSFAYTSPSGEKEALVLDNVSLKLHAREILAMVGPSGCGKTTLLNLIAGLNEPRSGSISFGDGGRQSGRIGYILQQDALFPWRKVRANLMLASDLNCGAVGEEKLAEFLATFHLDKSILNAYPDQLSGGMRQRVSIIQSLMFNPDILLLDEPFSALDFYTKLRLESEFHMLARHHNKSALLVTHDIDEAIAMSDRILVMRSTGSISRELEIKFDETTVTPEEVRGQPAFSDYYHTIWSELRSAIGA